MIGPLEELILLTIRSQDNPYGASIQKAIEYVLDDECSVGAIYTTLSRLKEKGMVSCYTGDSTPVRGGRAKVFYKLTYLGSKQLDTAEDIRNSIKLLKM